jgi:hypothetical protein
MNSPDNALLMAGWFELLRDENKAARKLTDTLLGVNPN